MDVSWIDISGMLSDVRGELSRIKRLIIDTPLVKPIDVSEREADRAIESIDKALVQVSNAKLYVDRVEFIKYIIRTKQNLIANSKHLKVHFQSR